MRSFVLALTIFALPAQAQQGVQPSGSFTPGHTVQVLNPSGTAIGDAGGSAGSALPGQNYLTELGITNAGAPLCINDALTNNPAGYHQMCLGANAFGGGVLSYNAVGGATELPLQLIVNGVTTTLPQSGSCIGCGTMAAQNANAVAITGGTGAFTQNLTGPISIDAATLSGATDVSLTAQQIVAWSFCASNDANCIATPENYDGVRGIGHMTAGSSINLVNGVGGYVVSDISLGTLKTAVALFGAGIVNANGGAVWGINTTINDCPYRTDCSSSATGRELFNEFDLSFSSTHSIGTGLNIGGNSVVQPLDSTGIGLTYLDDLNQGSIAKWGKFLGSLEGATNVFLFASTQNRNTGSTTTDSQKFQFGAYLGGTGTVGEFHYGSDSIFHYDHPINALAFNIPDAGGVGSGAALTIGATAASGTNIASYFQLFTYYNGASTRSNFAMHVDTGGILQFTNSNGSGTFNFEGALSVNNTIGVSCPSGVTAGTVVVVGGVVTHC